MIPKGRTLEQQIDAYKTALSRHRGPFRLAVWRPAPVTKDNLSGMRLEWVDTEDAVDDMVMYLGDPRDTVTSCDVWSEGEMMYVIQGRRKDFGFPEVEGPPVDQYFERRKPAEAEGRTDEMANKKKAASKAAPTTTESKPRGKASTAKGDGPQKGATVMAVFAEIKKAGSATVSEVFAALEKSDVKPSKDTVASCFSILRREGHIE